MRLDLKLSAFWNIIESGITTSGITYCVQPFLGHNPLEEPPKKALGSWMGLSNKALCPGMHFSENVLHPIGKISDRYALFLKFCVHYENAVKNSLVDFEPNFSRSSENE